MTFVQLMFKNLRRGRTRALLTAAGMAAAVAAVSALLSIAWNFAASAREVYASRKVDLVVVRAGVAERVNSSLSAAIQSQLSPLAGIAEVDGSLTEMVSFGRAAMVGIPLRGLDPSGLSIANLDLAEGRKLTSADHRRVLLGTSLAKLLGAKPGRTVEIEGTPFEVVGLFQSKAVLESATAVAPLVDVQELMDRAGRVSEFQVRVTPEFANEAGIRRLCNTIESIRDEHGAPLGVKAIPSREFADTDTETRLASATAWATSIIAMGLSIVAMMNTMLMSVLERRREVAVLRAIGWGRSRVLRMVVGESVILSLLVHSSARRQRSC